MFIGRAAVAAAAIAAPLAFAAPAMAAPFTDIQCAPCVGDINDDGINDPVWNELTSFGPWETGVETIVGDGWEGAVESVNGGAWEKAFPPAP